MRLFLILFFFSVQLSYAGNYCVTLTPQQEKILEDIIVDIQDWIDLAVIGKLNKSKKRVIRQELLESIAEGSTIPFSETAIINKRFNRPGYKNRKESKANLRNTP